MARITRTDVNERFVDGVSVSSTETVTDITIDVNKLAIHQLARDAIADLNTIIGAQSPTNAQVVAAVQQMARHQRGIIRVLLALDGADDLLDDDTIEV